MTDAAAAAGAVQQLDAPEQLERQLERAAACVSDHDEFLVASHREPDGDAAASTLAMAQLLEQFDKRAVCFNCDGLPTNMTFLDGAGEVTDRIPAGWTPEVTVLLDCSESERAGLPAAVVEDSAEMLVIDHHDTLEVGASDIVLHDASAAATGELVFRLLGELGGRLTPSIAKSIYAALLSDTGSFQYSNTSRSTFRIAGELLEAGVDPWEMTVEMFESQPERRILLLGDVLQTLELSSCGRLAFIEIDREMVQGAERPSDLVDGFINYGRSIRGVEVSTQFRERESGAWKVSFRSKGRVDVGEIARHFGGGGHVNAAGFTTDEEPEALRDELEETLHDLLGET